MFIPNRIFRNKKSFDDLIQLLLAIQAHGLPDFFDDTEPFSDEKGYQIFLTLNNTVMLSNILKEAVAINPLTQNLEPYITLPAHRQADFLSSYLTQYYKSLTAEDLDELSYYLPYYPPDEVFHYRLLIAKRRLELVLES